MTSYYIGADYCGVGEGPAMQKIAAVLRQHGHSVQVGGIYPNQEGAAHSVSKDKIFLFVVCGVAAATIWSFKMAAAAGSIPKTIFIHMGWTSTDKSSPMGSESNMLNCRFVPEHDAGQFMSGSSTSAMARDAGDAKTVGAYAQKYSQYIGVCWGSSPEDAANRIMNGQVTGFGGSGSYTGTSSSTGQAVDNVSPLLQGEMSFEELMGEICNGIDLLFLVKRSIVVVDDFESIYAEAKYLRDQNSKAAKGETINFWQLEEDSYELEVNQHGFYNTVFVEYKDGKVKESFDEYVRVYGEIPITYKDPKIDKTTAIMKAKAYLAAHVRDFNMSVNLAMLTDGDIEIGDIVTVDNPLTLNNQIRASENRDPEYLFVNGVNTSWEGESYISTDLELKLAPVSPKKLDVPASGTATGNSTSNGSNSGSGMIFDSCGVSNDKKYVLSFAQPSAGRGNYNYSTVYQTIFENKCPRCGKEALKWDSGRAGASCITCGGYHGSKREWGNISEGEVTCNSCCADFCGVTGWEKDGSFTSRLSIHQQPKESSKEESLKLSKGNYQL